MADYHIYMMRKDINPQIRRDLEVAFKGLKYKELKGVERFGERKNIYMESFAETDRIEVWQGDTAIRNNTEVILTLVFIGENRRQAYHDFVDYISVGEFEYTDDIRKRKFDFIFKNALEPSEDTLKGTEYIQADFVLQNLNGQTSDI